MTAPGAERGWTDSHCHVQHLEEQELSAVLGRAASAGVDRIVVVGTDAASSRLAAEVAASAVAGVEVWATAGLHPHDSSTGTADLRALLSTFQMSGLIGSRVVAIGECGLDYHYDYSPRTSQREAFAEQVALANEMGLALVIHTREAWSDTFAILEDQGMPERAVFHCFTGGPAEAERCLSMGAHLSFSGIVTFPNADEVREAVKLTPVDRLLVETDSPLLTPVPHRGKPNEPSFVPLVGEVLATVKEIEIRELAEATSYNAKAVFDLH